MRYLIFLMLLSSAVYAQSFPECGTDYACYYEKKAQLIEQDRQRQEQELEVYRGQQLELQREQLLEIQRQNDLLENELGAMNERQEKLEAEINALKEQNVPPVPVKEAQEENQESDNENKSETEISN